MINYANFDWGGSPSFFVQAATYEIFNNNIYQKYFSVNENDIVVDIGSSVGPFTYSILL